MKASTTHSFMVHEPGSTSLTRCKKLRKIMSTVCMKNWSMLHQAAAVQPRPARPASQLHHGVEERHDGGVVQPQLALREMAEMSWSSDLVICTTTLESTHARHFGCVGMTSAGAAGVPDGAAAGELLVDLAGAGSATFRAAINFW